MAAAHLAGAHLATTDETGAHISQCLGRIEEAQRFLAGLHGAERALAEARQALLTNTGDGQGFAHTPSLAISHAASYNASPPSPKTAAAAGTPSPRTSITMSVSPVLSSKAVGGLTPSQHADDSTLSPQAEKKSSVSTRSRVLCDQVIIGATEGRAANPDDHSEDGQRSHSSHHKVTGLGRIMLLPDSRLRMSWDMLGTFFIIFEVFAIPYNIAFNYEPSGPMFVFVSVMNSFFILDIGASFLTGFRQENGRVCLSPQKVARRYTRGMFIPDVAAGIPWEWLPVNSKMVQLSKTTRFLRLARLLRLLRIGIISERTRVIIEGNPSIGFSLGVGRVLVLLVGITHWAACGWYAVGCRGLQEGKSWMTGKVPEQGGEGVRYLYAAFFSLTTMTTVGYGDITAQNAAEVCFATFLLLIAAIIFPGILSAITDLMVMLNAERTQLNEKMQYLGKYMRWRSLPNHVFMDIRGYLQYLWETNKGYDEYEDELKKLLPPVLRKELCYHIYGGVLRAAPFFAWMRDIDVCLKELANAIENIIYTTGDVLFWVGQPNDRIALILSGTLRLSQNEYLFNEKEDSSSSSSSDESEEVGSGGQRHHTPNAAAKVSARLIDLLHSTRRGTIKRRHTNNVEQEKRTAGSPFFLSSIIDRASNRMAIDDEDRRWAASFIQRRWRSVRHNMKMRSPEGGKTMRSTTLTAPTYFGESCLWTPYDEWDSGPTPCYTYNVRCETRVELVDIPRSTVKELIERFSPWLRERFDFFRQAVVEGFHERSARRRESAEIRRMARRQNSMASLAGSAMSHKHRRASTASSTAGAASAATQEAAGSTKPAPPPTTTREAALSLPADMAEVHLLRQEDPTADLPRPHVEQVMAAIRSRTADLSFRSRQRATRLELQGHRRKLASTWSGSWRCPGSSSPGGAGSLADPLLGASGRSMV